VRLPIQAPAVIREALHRPTARLLGVLTPSDPFKNAWVTSVTCDKTKPLCRCNPTGSWPYYTYACCQTGQCAYDGSKCACK
jgi:hypothetical protein